MGNNKSSIGRFTAQGVGSFSIFENPKIQEKKKAGYVKTNIFKRREPIRLWVGSTTWTADLEFKFSLPHASQGSEVEEAIRVARNSVEPIDRTYGRVGPPVCSFEIYGSKFKYPPLIVTGYEISSDYELGAYDSDSRVVIIRMSVEEFHGWDVGGPTYLD